MSKFLSHPVLHFIVAGSLAYLLYAYLRPDTKETIEVTQQTIDLLVQQQESMQLAPIDSVQREDLIQGFVDDQVLMKEAEKRGLILNDGRVRKRVLSVMRSSFVEQIPAPSYAQLKEFYEQNRELYQIDSSWTFDQVFFNFNSQKIPEDPEAFLDVLDSSPNVALLSDFSSLSTRLREYTFQQIVGYFGRDFGIQLIQAPYNQWIGPVQSTSGIHYIRLIEQHPPRLPPFEQMENYLRSDYEFRKLREIQQSRIQELRKGYNIVFTES